MKIFSILIFSIIISLTFYSCKKDSSNSGTTNFSQWTYNGTTFTSDASDSTFLDKTGIEGSLLANAPDGGLGHYITIAFEPIPTTDGVYTYTLIDQYNQAYNIKPTQAWIEFGNWTGGNVTTYSQYSSAGGGEIKLTVFQGKVTATFSSIPAYSALTPSVTLTISGTLIQNAGGY